MCNCMHLGQMPSHVLCIQLQACRPQAAGIRPQPPTDPKFRPWLVAASTASTCGLARRCHWVPALPTGQALACMGTGTANTGRDIGQRLPGDTGRRGSQPVGHSTRATDNGASQGEEGHLHLKGSSTTRRRDHHRPRETKHRTNHTGCSHQGFVFADTLC